jgi:hypothetical protein
LGPGLERVFDIGFAMDDGLLSVADQLCRRIAVTAFERSRWRGGRCA